MRMIGTSSTTEKSATKIATKATIPPASPANWLGNVVMTSPFWRPSGAFAR